MGRKERPPLARLVRTKRLLAELSQEELAARAGVSRSLIAMVEAGIEPSIRSLKKIAGALGISGAELSAVLLAHEKEGGTQ
ncbi:helix-turn-helix domain-containing protein [Thermus sp. SYSU G05001]|uniref:Helix-turn-helix domain-containing protein n=1 Tax=Thermus brevis TaxID=2862456 RepID=A0ABS7A1J0_9DEIN|nr:helix-turn-helix domain-containing protein [Thermus brevis]